MNAFGIGLGEMALVAVITVALFAPALIDGALAHFKRYFR